MISYNINLDTMIISSSDGYSCSISRDNQRPCMEIMEPVPDSIYKIILDGDTMTTTDWREARAWLELGIYNR